jgi:alpha-galactosidase
MKPLLLLSLIVSCACGYDNGFPGAAYSPRGWNSWSTDDVSGLLDLCFEAEVKEVADALVSSGMKSAGYNWMVLDDCWSSTNRSAAGELQPDPLRFPSGIPALVSYLSARGLYLGLYTCAGSKTCKYNRPGSWGHYGRDARTLTGWGAKWIKADNCAAPPGPARDYFSNFSAAVNATGVPVVFQSCEWGLDDVAQWGPSVTQVYRVRPDHLPFWWFHLPNAYPPGGQGTGDIIEGMSDPAVLQGLGPFSFPDPDVLHTGLFQTEAETVTEFSFWALWGAPLLMATDPRNMTAFKRGVVLNEDVLAVQRDPVYAVARRVRASNATGAQLWVRPLAAANTAVVILYNAGDWQPADLEVSWGELGLAWLTPSTLVTAFDLWTKTQPVTQQASGAVARGVPPHGVAFWRLTTK